MYIDWVGVIFGGAAAGRLLATIYLMQERKTETLGAVAILFVGNVCLAYRRFFAIAHS